MPSRPFIVAALARRSSTINSNFSQARLTLIKRRFPTPDQTTRPGRTALTNTHRRKEGFGGEVNHLAPGGHCLRFSYDRS